SWGDMDNDGDLDLYVANGGFFLQGENNFLYRNNGDGQFVTITEGSAVTDNSQSMSPLWLDVDHDGDLDLYVTNYVVSDLFAYSGDVDHLVRSMPTTWSGA
ncbi:MAG: VCBS repeat-containing protein, partial [Deltaproteobacteria bacterium]|nr:VCBS repeat-containing protein [Deltaproteobacteria bacterium]